MGLNGEKMRHSEENQPEDKHRNGNTETKRNKDGKTNTVRQEHRIKKAVFQN